MSKEPLPTALSKELLPTALSKNFLPANFSKEPLPAALSKEPFADSLHTLCNQLATICHPMVSRSSYWGSNAFQKFSESNIVMLLGLWVGFSRKTSEVWENKPFTKHIVPPHGLQKFLHSIQCFAKVSNKENLYELGFLGRFFSEVVWKLLKLKVLGLWYSKIYLAPEFLICDKCFAKKYWFWWGHWAVFWFFFDFQHILFMVTAFQAIYEISKIIWSCDAMSFIQTPT